MTAILLIAVDSVRALLHQRLLVVLMLVTLGLTVLFSVLLTEAEGMDSSDVSKTLPLRGKVSMRKP